MRKNFRIKNVTALVALLVAGLLIGGAAFLATWDIPAPVAEKQEVLDDGRFPR